MLKQIYNNNLRISYKDEGIGSVIVLIHGFLESHEIWHKFDIELAKRYRVLSIDLPGHGLSDLHEEPFTMCKYAESVKTVLDHEKINKAFMIGHSMGGYVTLAFSEKYPKYLSGLCLFHSAPFSDSNEKLTARNITIESVRKGQFKSICKSHVRSVYNEENILEFNREIEFAENIALGMKEENAIASIITMRDRNDRSDILKNLHIPFLYIQGTKDKYIPMEILHKIEMPKKTKIVILEKSGHMGMIEEKEKSLKEINDFYRKYILNG